jgi:hypothetical protein
MKSKGGGKLEITLEDNKAYICGKIWHVTRSRVTYFYSSSLKFIFLTYK